MIVQLLIDGRRPNAHFGMVAMQIGKPDGGREKADETQFAGAELLQAIDRSDGGVAGREHRDRRR